MSVYLGAYARHVSSTPFLFFRRHVYHLQKFRVARKCLHIFCVVVNAANEDLFSEDELVRLVTMKVFLVSDNRTLVTLESVSCYSPYLPKTLSADCTQRRRVYESDIPQDLSSSDYSSIPVSCCGWCRGALMSAAPTPYLSSMSSQSITLGKMSGGVTAFPVHAVNVAYPQARERTPAAHVSIFGQREWPGTARSKIWTAERRPGRP